MNMMTNLLRRGITIVFLMAAIAVKAQSIDGYASGGTFENSSFGVGMYMGPDWKINVRLMTYQSNRVMITLRGVDNSIIYRETIRKAPAKYWRRFNFEGSKPGIYQFEISDGQQSIVRQINIVQVPRTDAQQYMTLAPQFVE